MMASVTLRVCRLLLRNTAISRFTAAYGPCPLSKLVFEPAGRSNASPCSFQPISVIHLHTTAATWKQGKKNKKAVKDEEKEEEEEEEDEDEDEDEDTSDFATDYRLVDCLVSALRVDAVAKSTLGIQRALVEQMMLEGKIRVNGQLCHKKGEPVRIGTMIDQLLEASPDNPDFSLVKRIVVHKIADRADGHGRVVITVKKWASLTVDDYKIGTDRSGDKDD